GVGYFRHALLFRQYAWTLSLPAAWFLPRLPVSLRAIIVAVWGLALLHVGLTLTRPADRDVVVVDTPNGERLYLEPDTATQVNAVIRELEKPGSERRPEVMFFPLGAGFHHFYAIPGTPRTVWFLPGFVRPYDEANLLATLDRTRAVVLLIPTEHTEPVSLDPSCWIQGLLSPAAQERFAARLEPARQVGPKCWVFQPRKD